MKKFLKTLGMSLVTAAASGVIDAAAATAQFGRWGKPADWGKAIGFGGVLYRMDPHKAEREERERSKIRVEG